jgi:putative Mn2+ efflux pump MntP
MSFRSEVPISGIPAPEILQTPNCGSFGARVEPHLPLISIIGIALGLAMDAFAVSLGASAFLRRITPRQYFRFSFHFGLFQFLMPVVGWLGGSTVAVLTAKFDHWVVFGLLALIGGKMIREALTDGAKGRLRGDPTRGWSLVALSVATSLDALAVGFSFALLAVNVWYPSVIIGLVAAGMTFLGMRLGGLLGHRFGRGMEIVGGLVLIAIGLRILWQHVSF